MSLYASSQTFITIAITRIQTSLTPPIVRDYYWGWTGYLNFTYWDESFDRGVDGADFTVELLGIEFTSALYVGDGEYLVFINTSLIPASTTYHTLSAIFSKPNHRDGTVSIQIRILEVPTELEVLVPVINSNPESYPGVFIVPYGDSLNITVFYNDTDNQEGFVGGLSGGVISLNEIFGPTRGLTSFNLVEIGNGYYYFIFDTLDPWLFASSVGDPGPQLVPYSLTFRIALENRSIADFDISVRIIELPTAYEIEQSDVQLLYGATGQLVVKYLDIWPGHLSGTLISGANFTINLDDSVFELLTVHEPYEDPIRPGYYIIEYTPASPFIGADIGTSDIHIVLSLPNAQQHVISLRVQVNPTPIAETLTTVFLYGTPISILIVLLIGMYIRVWSVPKRLRQINGLIKSIRKGKIPKAVSDAKSRQELVTDLFNDTFAELRISRALGQVPEESIPVEIPELGELLIQLSILTNLNQQELDDFKADITKMKLSEQAAFVKEVIMQEALRAARREGKTVEEIIDRVSTEAVKKLAGEKGVGDVLEAEVVSIEEPEEPEEVERVFLPEDEDVLEDEFISEQEALPGPKEDISFTSETLSPLEIDELKKELQEKDIPPAEIDIILKQAKELPKELVEELVKSLDAELLRE